MRYFMTLLFVLLAYAVFAQNDPKAKEILDKAAAKFKAYPAAEIDFTLTMENPSENIHEMHEGKAWMKGNLYKLNVMDVENYYDGKNIYTYMPEVQEVNIKNPNEGFDQKLVSTGNDITYIELFPTDKSRNFTKIGIWVNPATSSIQKVTSFGKDGNNVLITIKSIKQSSPVPADSFFKFDPAKHPEVEVIDLR